MRRSRDCTEMTSGQSRAGAGVEVADVPNRRRCRGDTVGRKLMAMSAGKEAG
jgi:hypothetical protein